MPFNFRMTFSGLLAVVPDKPFAETVEPAQSATLLIPNLLQPRQLNNRQQNGNFEILDPHIPALAFQNEDREDKSTRGTDLHIPAENLSLCLLDNEEIEILPIPNLAAGFKMRTEMPGNRREPTPQSEDEKSLFWLATMQQASPGNGMLKDGLITQPLGGKVITRIKLERGELSTHEVSDSLCRLSPRRRNNLFERKVAASLQIFIENVPKQVSLSMKKQGNQPTTLTFAPPEDQPNKEILVRLVNWEFEDIRNMKRDIAAEERSVSPNPNRPVADFEVFYDLVQGFNNGGTRTFLQEVVEGPGTDRPHALCPPTGLTIGVGGGGG